MTIGERIKKRRKEMGLTQLEVARRANMGRQLLFKYENEVITNIPSNRIEDLAKALEVSPSYIMGWSETDTEIEIPDRVKEICETLPKEKKQMLLAFAEFLKEYK